MTTNPIEIINQQIEQLIHDTSKHHFDDLKKQIEVILKGVDIFMVEGELDAKAVDMYLKKVITQRNELQKQHEQAKLKNEKIEKYTLIETICKTYEFQTQEALIQKIEALEKKSLTELKEMLQP